MAQNQQKSKIAPKRKKKTEPIDIEYSLPRPAWGVIYGVLGVFSLLVVFGLDGALLKLIRSLIGGLMGYGLYLVPIVLLTLCAMLIKNKKGPIRLRASAVALFPVFLSSIVHCLLNSSMLSSNAVFSTLATTGADIKSGGLIAGGLAYLLSWAFSSVGGFLLCLILLIADLMIIFRITPQSIYDALRPIEYEYDDEEERMKYETHTVLPNVHELAANQKAKREAKKTAKRAAFDIALDDEEEPILTLSESKNEPEPIIDFSSNEFIHETNVSNDNSSDDPFDDILSLLHNKPDEKTEVISNEPMPIDEKNMSKAQLKRHEQMEQAKMAAQIDANQSSPMPVYSYPQLDLLNPPKKSTDNNYQAELTEYSHRLVDTLQSFNIEAQIVGIVRGPTVTRFEVTIPPGTKFSRITGLSDDIALALGAMSVRIAPIPEKVAIGIEVPNKTNTVVPIYDVLDSDAFKNSKSKVSFCVGKDITGAPVVGNIGKMPHLLIAGTTGSGKSVCVNSMLISLLYKSTPEEVRLIMIDPKMVELGNYNGIPHLLIPVVTDPKKAAGALNWAVGEMERRYKVFADNQVRKLEDFNELMQKKRKQAQQDGTPSDGFQPLPEIVIVIDELADLMMVAAKEVETSICRIAQKARAAGMYLIVATQRPSADVITGIMKANIPSRIAFAVASQIESRIILDTTGAEKLIGKGDMLYAPLGEGKPQRIQGCFISNDEIENVIEFIKSTGCAEYNEEILEHIEKSAEASENGSSGGGGSLSGDEDEMLMEAIEIVVDCGQASVSMLQRRLKLGYARAARIVDQMEERGIVGPFEGSKPRQILISKDDWKEMKLRRQL